MLRIIERATRQQIAQMNLPSVAAVNEQRVAKFKQRIADAIAEDETQAFRAIVEEFQAEHNVSALDVAAALASLLQGSTPVLLPEKAEPEQGVRNWNPRDRHHADIGPRHGRRQRDEGSRAHDADRDDRGRGTRDRDNDVAFETFRLEVGHTHGVKPGNIVGAIANEAGLEGRHIGHVDIRDDHSFVDLPEGMPREIFRNLQKVRVVGQELRISRVDGKPPRQH